MSVKGEVEALSFDHIPTSGGRRPVLIAFLLVADGSTVERARIHDAGGYIESGRVNGACPVFVHCCEAPH